VRKITNFIGKTLIYDIFRIDNDVKTILFWTTAAHSHVHQTWSMISDDYLTGNSLWKNAHFFSCSISVSFHPVTTSKIISNIPLLLSEIHSSIFQVIRIRIILQKKIPIVMRCYWRTSELIVRWNNMKHTKLFSLLPWFIQKYVQ
jgi:hypothetical protein